MQEKELKFYEEIGNWDFSKIKVITEKLTNWDYFEEIAKHTNENSLCLDLGTGGGERVLKRYPKVGMIIATDFSDEMIKTAKENLKKYSNSKVKFAKMNNLEMKFPDEILDLVSAKHTIINAKQIYDCLTKGGTLVIEGIDKKDCWELKEIFGRGQAYDDEIAISEKDYQEIKEAGFEEIQKIEIIQNEYYEAKEDLLTLLMKTPIINDFSGTNERLENKKIELDLLGKYIEKYKTKKGILLKRKLYGIVAQK